MKKLVALLLALVMVAALGVSALAATPDNGTITIQNATNGQTYQAYKILDASSNGDKVVYTTKTPALFEGSPFTVSEKADKDGNYSVTVAEDADVISWLKANYTNFPKAGDPVKADGSPVVLSVTEGYYFVTSTLGAAVSIDTLTGTEKVIIDKNEQNPGNPDKTINEEDGAQLPDPLDLDRLGGGPRGIGRPVPHDQGHADHGRVPP